MQMRTLIRKGITGFRNSTEPALPTVPFSNFKSACYTFARSVGAQVAESQQASIGNNHHQALLTVGSGDILVLCNAIHPVIAFAVPLSNGSQNLAFIDDSQLEKAFRVGKFTVASRDELETPVSEIVLDILTAAERHQVQYWKPKRVGDIVFNFWD